MNDEVLSYQKKDFVSDQEVRWCPGCGDYSVLASLQLVLTKAGKKKEDIVCVSGIGCSSRFPYYMNTYGFHTIHGRAPAVATGLKLANPNLSIWVITGDGDGLSIGGNHLIHAARRNIDLNILLFNNEIYGLTKGQYSPTSCPGKITKSTPYGSLDNTFNPGKLMLASGATFIAKAIDTDLKEMMSMMSSADKHKGTSFIEIYQNCVIFNDKAHDLYSNRAHRDENSVVVEHGKPLIFGKNKNKGIILDGFDLKIVEIGKDCEEKDLLVHDKYNEMLAYLLLEKSHPPEFPMVLGLIYEKESSSYDDLVTEQIKKVQGKKGGGDFNKLLHSGDTWVVS